MAIPKGRTVAASAGTGSHRSKADTSSTRKSSADSGSGTSGELWTPLVVDNGRYVVMCIYGSDQTGKNHFAYSAPDPIVCLTFDPVNQRGVAKKFAVPPLGPKSIYIAEFELPKGLVNTAKMADIAASERNRYFKTFTAAVSDPAIRTIIMDREDEAWELWRFAEFDGTASQKAHHYVAINSEYKGMLKLAAKNGKNLIMLDNVKDEWKSEKPTGRTIREGFKHIGMITEVMMEAKRGMYDDFSMEVKSNRDDATRNGRSLTPAILGEHYQTTTEDGQYWWADMDFPNVMGYLINDSGQEEWR